MKSGRVMKSDLMVQKLSILRKKGIGRDSLGREEKTA